MISVIPDTGPTASIDEDSALPLTVTGTYRSGTTLVERLIDQHPAAAIASQPLPHLWLAAKRAYLEDRGVRARIPLGSLFRDPHHDPAALAAFLAVWPDDPEAVLKSVVTAQRGYSGAMTPEVDGLKVGLAIDGGFDALVRSWYAQIAALTGRHDRAVVGAKEIVIEEFVPMLLEWGHHVVLVIRDLRAVVASAMHEGAKAFVGEVRPTLFTVRAWRRSVATALAYGHHPRCHVVRYEDVVDRPDQVAEIWRACDLAPPDLGFRLDLDRLCDQYGLPWRANTSFDRRPAGSERSLARALETLDTRTREYLEAVGGPELLATGYVTAVSGDPERSIRRFAEPVPVRRADLDPHMSTSRASIDDEMRRLDMLAGPYPDDVTAREWFLHPWAYVRLREAVQSGTVGPQ